MKNHSKAWLEKNRLEDLYSYDILDTHQESIFDDITFIASIISGSPIAAITLIDKNRQWFKSIKGLDAVETPRDVAFCHHAIKSNTILEVTDATIDKRFSDNPFVLHDPKIRFYAGAPLTTPNQYNLGTLCVVDVKPKKLSNMQLDILKRLSHVVMSLFESNKSRGKQLKEIEVSKKQLENEKRFLKVLLDNLNEGIVACDENKNINIFNSAAERLLKRKPRPMDFSKWAKYYSIYTADGKKLFKSNDLPLVRAMNGERINSQEIVIKLSKDNIKNVLVTSKPIIDHKNKKIGAVAILNDFTDKKQLEEYLAHTATHDSLTSLPNRYLMTTYLEKKMGETLQCKKKLAIVFIDLDNFKMVNDNFGHNVGDQLLVKIAHQLLACKRKRDFVARLGGDEFIMILNSVTDEAKAQKVMQPILDIFKENFVLNGQIFNISCSVGISFFPNHGKTIPEMLQHADIAMYRSKKATQGNSISFYHHKYAESLKAHYTLINDLKNGIVQKNFLMYYQPILNLQDDTITGFEALLRWNHPTKGILLPKDFLKELEENNFISAVSAITFPMACKQIKQWQIKFNREFNLSYNLSGSQIESSQSYDLITSALAAGDLNPINLEIEITEDTLVSNAAKAQILLKQLRGLGSQIAFDDWGIGYSSLSYLHKFPGTRLKIDISFIRKILKCKKTALLVKTILLLAQNLELKTTAEGIEEVKQKELLRELGCQEGQGYLFSQPLNPIECEAYIKNKLKLN